MENDGSVGSRGDRGEDRPRVDEAFVAQMKRRRALLNLSQGELASRLAALGESLYQQTIAKIEAGQRALKLSEAAAIAQALGTTVQGMLDGVYADPPALSQDASVDVGALEREAQRTLAQLEEAHRNEVAARERVAALRSTLLSARAALQDAETALSSANMAFVAAAEKRTRLADKYHRHMSDLNEWRKLEKETGKRHRPRKRGAGFVVAEEPKDHDSGTGSSQ